MLVTIITCMGLVCTIACGVFATRSAHQRGTSLGAVPMVWGTAFALLQLFIAIWSGIGLVQDGMLPAFVFNIAACGCAWVSFNRAVVQQRLTALIGPEGRFDNAAGMHGRNRMG